MSAPRQEGETLARLREALAPFAKASAENEHETNPFALVLVQVGDLRRARAALTEEADDAREET
jgi:hypothetical protein